MNIKELAEQSGIGESITNKGVYIAHDYELKHFAKLVRQEEREACAKLCESIAKPEENIYYTAPLIDIAIAAIRGRTE
jgi:hypothetical protein